MKGKYVNLVLGIMNAFVGILILIYSKVIPEDILSVTIQEMSVINIINIALFALLAITAIINILYVFINRKDKIFCFGYLLGIFAILFIPIHAVYMCTFSFMSALIIIIMSLKENMVDVNNMVMISIVVTIIGLIIVLSGTCFAYKWIGEQIRDKDNEGELKYSNDFFKYITELDIDDIYINVKNEEGKWGYINQDGNTVIDFKYDYASPFININVYNKNFKIALVCDSKSTKIILKNERKVLSYKTESNNNDYSRKLEELNNIYTNTLNQTGEMKYEIARNKEDYLEKRPVYVEQTEDYTYRYDYNNEYDVIITESITGKNKYELARKSNINIRFTLECDSLDYDSNYLYVYKNGCIPFYNISSREQGWFNSVGKKTTMQGKAQILELVDDIILLKNYNDNTVYFIDKSGNIVSPVYKEVYVCDNYYIVKNTNNKFMFIDKQYQKMFEEEFDYVNTAFSYLNIYICANLGENLTFNDYGYANINYQLITSDAVSLGQYQDIYNLDCKISTNKKENYIDRYNQFLNSIGTLNYKYVGDKFYINYK